MAGESPNLRQDDIEELLRQAQMAAGVVPDAAPPEPAAGLVGTPSAPPGPAPQSPRPSPTPAVTVSAPVLQPPGTSTATISPPAPNSTPVPRPGPNAAGDDISFLLAQAEQAIASVDQPVDPALQNLTPFEFRDLTGSPPSGEKVTLELLKDVDLDLRIELGRTQMYLEDVLKLKRGAVVALEKLAGDPVDVFVNGRIVARGEVLVLNDNFCVRVTELLSGDDFD